MRLVFYLCLTLAVVEFGFAQEVTMIRKGRLLPKVKQNERFYFLHKNIDTTSLIFVGAFEATGFGKESTVVSLYEAIKVTAKKSGANSFQLVSITSGDGQDPGKLVVNAYSSDDATLARSENLKRKNVIYLFSGEKKLDKKVTAFKINNEPEELESGKYVQLDLVEDEKIKISKGGITGMSVTLTGSEDKPATYLSLTGYGVGPGVAQPGTVGISINTGRIYPIESSLGELLTLAFEKSDQGASH